MSDEIHDALLRRALGFDCEETVDEYGFSEGEEVLVKRKAQGDKKIRAARHIGGKTAAGGKAARGVFR